MYCQEESWISMDEFGDRLKGERSRLRLSQAEFAALGGVKQRAQFQYEKGMRHPNSEYLSALAVSGVDVWYLLTGEKGARLENSEEQRIVAEFRQLDARRREALFALLEAFAQTSKQ
jgi:transcriptional regulator with XRE-family HTH domain